MAERLGEQRYKPVGEWVQTTMAIPVVGIQHRKNDANSFVSAVRKAERTRLRYGVQVEHQPGNKHDPNALAVYGYADFKGWFRSGTSRWHVGFLDRDSAEELARDLIAHSVPLELELYHIWIGDTGFVDIKVIVLAPPGFGLKARLRRNK